MKKLNWEPWLAALIIVAVFIGELVVGFKFFVK